MKTPLDDIIHEVVKEDDSWIYGKTYHGTIYFCDWVKSKQVGNPPTVSELKEIEDRRIEKADAYRVSHPHTSTSEYFAAIKRYPLKEN